MSVTADFRIRRGDFDLDVHLAIARGEVLALLGPNGAGKSTTLRALAGLDRIDAGSIDIAGSCVDDGGRRFVPPRRRPIGVVFQDYALFPHLSVAENVAFGPRARGDSRQVARQAAAGVLERLDLIDLADRRPSELSGGQGQRVALARALACQPTLLLLDEPLAALDAQSRDAVRLELRRRLDGFAGATLLITHEPLDAMILADRVLVLQEGRVVQDGTPADMARQPATSYVASLLGVNLLHGTARDGVLVLDGGGSLPITDRSMSGAALVMLRPESITLAREPLPATTHHEWPGVVSAVEALPGRARVHVQGKPSLIASITPEAIAALDLRIGTNVWLRVMRAELQAYAGMPVAQHRSDSHPNG